PTSYAAFKTRLSRWTRGDWQISRWLKGKLKDREGKEYKNPLGLVSKYKILNNLVKSIFEIVAILSILFLLVLDLFANIRIWPLMTVTIVSITIASIIEIANKIIYKKDGENGQKTFYKSVSGIK